MLTIIADAMLTAMRREKWPAPDHWKAGRPLRGDHRHDHEVEYRRKGPYRDTVPW